MTKHLKDSKSEKVSELTVAQARSQAVKWTLGDLNPRLLGCKPSVLPS